MATEKKKPVQQIRKGAVVASIWETEGKKGRYYKFTVERIYANDGGWKSTDSFSASDAKNLAFVALAAEEEIAARLFATSTSEPTA
jgi:hypothetical protein